MFMHSSEIRATVAARRAKLGLSQTEAGAACAPPIGQQTISNLETGTDQTGIETLARYARQALGCRLVLALIPVEGLVALRSRR